MMMSFGPEDLQQSLQSVPQRAVILGDREWGNSLYTQGADLQQFLNYSRINMNIYWTS